MNHKNIVLILTILLVFAKSNNVNGQGSGNDWFHIPGFIPENPVTRISPNTFYCVAGAATVSYVLAELVFKRYENLNYYQARLGMNNEYFWGYRKVYLENFGVEKRISSGFAVALEYNFQQWSDQTPNIDNEYSFGLGAGIMSYYRWYLFGKRRISPYLEFGVGLFYGVENFPYNGTNFSFNNSTQLGLEFTLKSKDKIRVGYGQFHQSNNDIDQPNPGYDANGFSLSYSWFWKKTKW